MTTAENRATIAIVLVLLTGIPIASEATNGYFSNGHGARSMALAGASTALPQDAFTATVNPAGLTYLGDRFDLDIKLLHPQRQFTVEGQPVAAPGAFPLYPGTVESDSEWFPIPSFGLSRKIDSEQAIALAVYAKGGVNTDYVATMNPLCGPRGAGVLCAGTVGIDLSQVFFEPAYAHSFGGGKFSLGIAPIVAVQRFKARGLKAFAAFSGDDGHLSDQGYEYSVGGGLRVGLLAEPISGFRLGASYESRVFMTPFNEYSGLLAEKGSLDIPESFNIGLSWDIFGPLTAAFDVERIRYSQISSLSNPILPNLLSSRLGAESGAGLGLRDMTVFKLGLQWRPGPTWIGRAGVSYGRQPIPESEVLFNILAPGVAQFHFTAGCSYALGNDDEIAFAFMYAPNESLKGPNPLSPGQTIELEMKQMSFQLAWSRRF
ncbi:MAG: OmpP1/FadL family transporter [Gammaproteobacteria bacterium]